VSAVVTDLFSFFAAGLSESSSDLLLDMTREEGRWSEIELSMT
jgi:hypothetical protein